ncbi:MAG: hypothetical protein ABFS10_07955 [Bacteroidota bacterium]
METEIFAGDFREIDLREQQEINGGVFPILVGIVIGITVTAGGELFRDWDNFKNGLTGRPEEEN